MRTDLGADLACSLTWPQPFFFKANQSKLGKWTRIKIGSPSGFSEGEDSP